MTNHAESASAPQGPSQSSWRRPIMPPGLRDYPDQRPRSHMAYTERGAFCIHEIASPGELRAFMARPEGRAYVLGLLTGQFAIEDGQYILPDDPNDRWQADPASLPRDPWLPAALERVLGPEGGREVLASLGALGLAPGESAATAEAPVQPPQGAATSSTPPFNNSCTI